MQTIEKLLTYPEATDTEVEELLQKASDIVIGNLDVFTEKFQHSNSEMVSMKRYRISAGQLASGQEKSGLLMKNKR